MSWSDYLSTNIRDYCFTNSTSSPAAEIPAGNTDISVYVAESIIVSAVRMTSSRNIQHIISGIFLLFISIIVEPFIQFCDKVIKKLVLYIIDRYSDQISDLLTSKKVINYTKKYLPQLTRSASGSMVSSAKKWACGWKDYLGEFIFNIAPPVEPKKKMYLYEHAKENLESRDISRIVLGILQCLAVIFVDPILYFFRPQFEVFIARFTKIGMDIATSKQVIELGLKCVPKISKNITSMLYNECQRKVSHVFTNTIAGLRNIFN